MQKGIQITLRYQPIIPRLIRTVYDLVCDGLNELQDPPKYGVLKCLAIKTNAETVAKYRFFQMSLIVF